MKTVYDVIQVNEAGWFMDHLSNWTFDFTILNTCKTLQEAQSIHANIIHTYGFETVGDGWHKYAILSRDIEDDTNA